MWTGRCCLFPILLFGVAVVGWELSPFPSTYVSYNQRPQESVCAFLVSHYSVSLGICFRFFLGVLQPTTLARSQLHQMHLMHPTWFDTALHRWRKTTGEHATTISVLLKRFLGSISRLLSSTMELPLVPFSVVPGPHWPRQEWWCFWDTGHYDHLGRQEGHCQVLWHSQLGRWPWNDLNAWPFFWRRGL